MEYRYPPSELYEPTPGEAKTFYGGTKISTEDESQFLDEKLGDVVMYARHASQQLLLGKPTHYGRSAMAIGSNEVRMNSTLVCTSLVGTTGISLSLGGPLSNSVPPHLTGLATQLTNDTLYAKAMATSNTVFGAMEIAGLYSNAANGLCNMYAVCNVTFKAPVTFADVTMCNLTLPASNARLTVGSNGNPGSYPVCIHTATQNGGVSLYCAGDITQFSDQRWKTDIVPIADALDKVLAIGGYTFRRNDDLPDDSSREKKRMAGVLAQEVREVLPEVVDVDDDGRLHVAYGNLAALLIEATKQLAGNRALLRVTTRTEDEAFSLPLPTGAPWAAAFVTGVDAYSRATATVDCRDGACRVVGRIESPGTYNLLVVR